MKKQNPHDDAFDPTAPVGADGGEVLRPADEAADARDERLAKLLDSATRPPAELKLDWSRLRAGLAASQPNRAAAQPTSRAVSEPARPRAVSEPARPRARRIILWFAGAMSAAAAVVLSTVLLLHDGGGNTTGQSGQQAKVQTGDTGPLAVAAAQAETVSFGVAGDDAESLLDRPTGDDSGIVVVFPRQSPPTQAPAAGPPAVLVVSSQSGMAGTPRDDRGGDFDDFGIMSF